MTECPDHPPPPPVPRRRGRHVFAVLALLALAAVPAIWIWNIKTKDVDLSLGSGMELRYRAGMTDVLGEEASDRDLDIQFHWSTQSAEAIQQVNRRELDAAIIPAGLAIAADNVRHVTMLDCEVLHLFVRAELSKAGVAGLRGKRLYLGPPGSGMRLVAGEVLQFLGMKPGDDYQDENYSFQDLMKLSPDMMPDGVFGLSPLPSPLGERLARRYGYQLLELPLGEALSLRKPYYEDICVPPSAYRANPPVPEKSLHTVGVRAMLIAHRNVPKAAVQRLLETLYESDFAQRVGMRPLSPTLLQRSGEYPDHAGMLAYVHRNDPLIDHKLTSMLGSLGGSIVSVFSAALLAWQWFRRRHGDIGHYLRDCNRLDLKAQQAAGEGEFNETELATCLMQLARLKAEILERHQESILAGDKQFVDLVERIEGLQQTLLSLVRTTNPRERISLAFPPLMRKAS